MGGGGERGWLQQALSDVLEEEELFCEMLMLWDPPLAGWGLFTTSSFFF